MRLPLSFALLLASAPPAAAADTLSLDELLDTYRSSAPGQPDADVRLEGWIEDRPAGGREVVIVLDPEGETKLNADPGITVTPADANVVRWNVVLPHRHQDQSIDYFEPQATIRMPFDGEPTEPIVVLVEYAYCVVDFQCFFGEEELTLAALD